MQKAILFNGFNNPFWSLEAELAESFNNLLLGKLRHYKNKFETKPR